MGDLGDDPRPVRGAVRQVYGIERAASLEYSPDLDGLADPGEIVWAWVPYEEDPERGKDRPLLVIGRHKRKLLAMMLSSQGGDPDRRDHDDWLSLGSGAWDRNDRVSYLRLDRLYELDDDDIRREGAILDRAAFARAAALLKQQYGWSSAH